MLYKPEEESAVYQEKFVINWAENKSSIFEYYSKSCILSLFENSDCFNKGHVHYRQSTIAKKQTKRRLKTLSIL